MKSTRWILVALVVALCLAVVPPALAHPGAAKGKVKFEAVGKVAVGGVTAATLTVTVKAGTKTIKEFRGKDVPMIVLPTTNVRVAIAHEWLPGAKLADVAPGARVKVRGTFMVDRTTDPANPLKVFTVTSIKAWQAAAVSAPTP